jgi:mono/diheme cytochrome c family protein
MRQWLGPHQRVRGTLRVEGPAATPGKPPEPLYARLGLDIDAVVTPLANPPGEPPSAARGAALGIRLPGAYTSLDYVESHSPAELYTALKAEPLGQRLPDDQIWDLVAYAWQSALTPQMAARGQALYAQNCAACHGETGAGDGVMASVSPTAPAMQPTAPGVEGMSPGYGHAAEPPTDFTDPARTLALNSARLQGKILRGGMGTGMPSWGAIFSEPDTWALVAYLWTFTMR